MAARVDYFYSFRSPYSYLSAPRAFALADDYEIDLRFRGVIPMMMRGQSVPTAKRIHTLRDAKREADRLKMPFGHIHDPLGEGATRCLGVSEHAIDLGRQREFVLSAGQGIWSEATDPATEPGLRLICERAGLEWEGCRAALSDPAIADRVEANTQELLDIGHWGVPVFVYEGEQFWGQDRIDDLALVLSDAGLDRRL
ncbi:MAG: DsbA family protein [Solirubrobacterales bacterium]|nr:DsbA family protein [Solirubrobacterales bacterium]